MVTHEALPRQVIILGGTGGFGERLVRGLVAHTAFDVIIAARDLDRAQALAEALGGAPRLRAVRLDARRVTAAGLRALGGFALVDAAGPFQGGDTRLAEAAIAAGLHYTDLADARDFVARFATPALDAAARAAGAVALTGASSTPALSGAALAALTQGWRRIDRVEVAIAPGNRGAPRGLSVFRAILSYVGQPITLRLEGRVQQRPGWSMLGRPILPGLGRRWLALCETPDLDQPVAEHAVFRAGLELGVLHLGLWLATLPVRWGWVRSLAPLARPSRWVAGLLHRFGSDRGGMLVMAQGIDAEGCLVRATWSLLACDGDGPVIPGLPALALLRALDAGRIAPGAGVASVLGLEAIAAECAPWRITTATDRQVLAPLFVAALGARFATLPAPLRALHGAGFRAWRGEAEVVPARGWLARILARMVRFPRTAGRVTLRVTMMAEPDGSEVWTRHFGEAPPLRSRLFPCTPGVVEEAMGPLRVRLALQPDTTGLTLRCAGWRLGPLPLPTALAPRSTCLESVDAEGRFAFDVPVAMPLIGAVVRYRGWLVPDMAG